MSQTFTLTEHREGVHISWTMARGQAKVLAATISRPQNYEPKGKPWKHPKAGKQKR